MRKHYQTKPRRQARIRFSDELRDCIERDGRSPYAIARAAEISPAQLSRFLRGIRGLNTDTLDLLAAALGLHLHATSARPRGRPRRDAPAEDPEAAAELEPAGFV